MPQARMWLAADGGPPPGVHPALMRIVVALGRRETAPGEALAPLARDHELVISHGEDPVKAAALALALRNDLPDHDVVAVLAHVVLAGEDTAAGRPPAAPALPEPRAIAELRSLRALVEAGSLVLCSVAGDPVALDPVGGMRRVRAAVDADLSASLLARRLDADLFLLGGGGSGPSGCEAAKRFEAATGRPAARLSPDGALPVAR